MTINPKAMFLSVQFDFDISGTHTQIPMCRGETTLQFPLICIFEGQGVKCSMAKLHGGKMDFALVNTHRDELMFSILYAQCRNASGYVKTA